MDRCTNQRNIMFKAGSQIAGLALKSSSTSWHSAIRKVPTSGHEERAYGTLIKKIDGRNAGAEPSTTVDIPPATAAIRALLDLFQIRGTKVHQIYKRNKLTLGSG